MNCILPRAGYLQGLRELCTQHGALLIFDEVMTGFRVALGGAQALYGVTPDLTTFGKIIGGGMPVGAYGGRRDVMEQIAPGRADLSGRHAVSGNPVAMAAGLAMLELIQAPGFHADLERKTQSADRRPARGGDRGRRAVQHQPRRRHVRPVLQRGEGRNATRRRPPATSTRSTASSTRMLERGVYLAPSAFEAGFMSSAHTEQDIADTLQAAREAFRG